MSWAAKLTQFAREVLFHASKETIASVLTALAFLLLSPLVYSFTGKTLDAEAERGELVTINLSLFSAGGASPPVAKEAPPAAATEQPIKEGDRQIATASLRVCRDEQGQELGKLRVVTFSTEYHWDFNSSNKVWLGDAEIEDFPGEVLATPGLQSYLGTREVVTVGMASCEGNAERGLCLAYDRANTLKGWVRTRRSAAQDSPGYDDLHTLNLGRVKEECGGRLLNKIFDTGSQRPLMIIGVTGEYSPEQLEYCLHKVLSEDEQGKMAKLLEGYSRFELDAPRPQHCPKKKP